MKYKTIPLKTLRNLLVANSETGKLLWKKRSLSPRWNSRCAGKPALESITPDGHYRGSVLGKILFAHRVIWALHYGAWPKYQIDHINQNKTATIKKIANVERTIPLAQRASISKRAPLKNNGSP